MNERMSPKAAWSTGLGLWCHVWQKQIDASLRVTASLTQGVAKPDAQALAQAAMRQAEKVRLAERRLSKRHPDLQPAE